MLFLRALIASALFSCSALTAKSVAEARINQLDVNDDPRVNVFAENTTPIIGVLTQEVSRLILREYPQRHFTSYIAASYVKFVEGAGGRVVPIWIGQPRDYYMDVMSKINGVLLPGGATYFNQSEGYADAGKHIFEIAKDMNDHGVHMPVWGTCLGFELLVYHSANGTDPRTGCASSRQALPLEFKEDFRKSRLFQNASDEIVNILENYAVTANFHIFCFTEETFATLKLNDVWKVMSVNHDWNGVEFISTIEHKKYPFYGVQFHPEKNLYEFVPNHNITHTSQAIRASQYFANFIVDEARKNPNRFTNKTEEAESLIYNYQPEYTATVGSVFAQQYLFEVALNSAALLQPLPAVLLSLFWIAFVALGAGNTGGSSWLAA